MQALFRNPLADPFLTGMSAGVAVGALGAILYLDAAIHASLFGLCGVVTGLLTTALIYYLFTLKKYAPSYHLLLIGIAINSFCSGLIGLFLFYSNTIQLRNFTFWSLGSLCSVDWTTTTWVMLLCGLPCVLLLSMSHELDAILLGDGEALSLGIDIRKQQIRVLLLSSLIVGSAVSFCGVIGFVGILVPHAVRLLSGATHKTLLPLSWLYGALLLLSADTLIRQLHVFGEMPIGIITAFLGAPVFLIISSTQRN